MNAERGTAAEGLRSRADAGADARTFAVSTDARRRARVRRLTLALLAAVVVALAACNVLLGDYQVTVGDFFRILAGHDISSAPAASYIVMQSKLPRTVAGLLAGALLGAAGAATQSLVRNPLASPDVLGISLGASTTAVFAVTVLGWSGAVIPAVALCGALAVSAVILLLARGQTGRMILVGIAMAAALQSVIQWVLLKSTAYQAQDAMIWLAGSTTEADWPGIGRLAVVAAVVLTALALMSARLRVLELGRPLALGLGIPVRTTQALVLGCVVLGVAVATSVCGPIAFIALLSGPIAHRLMGRTSPVAAALVGAGITVAGDYIGHYLVPGADLPVGVITGFAGAPVLAWLLVSAQRRGRTAHGGMSTPLAAVRERLAKGAN